MSGTLRPDENTATARLRKGWTTAAGVKFPAAPNDLAFAQTIGGASSLLVLSYALDRFWSAILYGETVTGAQLLEAGALTSCSSCPITVATSAHHRKGQPS